mmetsp:Transcript_1968/g.5525  ORF Transcript_1968/g.5525 Transcript_1968/m.5525 type:complete len:423 (-) Transcript_1968:88-1356(-)
MQSVLDTSGAVARPVRHGTKARAREPHGWIGGLFGWRRGSSGAGRLRAPQPERSAPSHHGRPPGEAGAKPRHGDDVALLHLAGADGRVERERDGARRGVSVLVEVVDHLAHRDLELLRHRLHDADVGLVQQQPVHLVGSDARVLERLPHHLGHARGCKLVHLLADHRDGRVRPRGDGRDRRERPLYTGVPEAEVGPSGAVRVQREAEHAFLSLAVDGGLQHDCTGAVAKQDARVAIAPVHPAGESVGADDERRLIRASVQELRRGGDAEEETGARSGEVEGDGAGGANLARDVRGVAKQVVRARGRQHHQLHRGRVHAAALERFLRRPRRERGEALAGREQVALPDARPLGDPVVRSLDHRRELLVGHDGVRRSRADANETRAERTAVSLDSAWRRAPAPLDACRARRHGAELLRQSDRACD